jgi:restriction endonuclease S subunit
MFQNFREKSVSTAVNSLIMVIKRNYYGILNLNSKIYILCCFNNNLDKFLSER